MNSELMKKTFWNNTLAAYVTFLIVFVSVTAVLLLVQFIVLKRLRKQTEAKHKKTPDFILQTIRQNVMPVMFFAAAYFSLKLLNVTEAFYKVANAVMTAVVFFFAIRMVARVVNYGMRNKIGATKTAKTNATHLNGLIPAVNVLIWFIGALFLLESLGLDVKAIVAGLGIGGVAVALAAQAVLGDLFSYFSILLDKPFEIGDFIVAGSLMGTIEKIGLKTTRIRSLSGELLVFANSDLTSSRIQNFRHMKERRVVFHFGVEYSTPPAKLKQIPELVRHIIEETPETRFDRAHFHNFGDSSLDFEVVYYILSPDYNLHMDTLQEIHLKLFETLNKKGVAFAFPTRKVVVEHETAEEK